MSTSAINMLGYGANLAAVRILLDREFDTRRLVVARLLNSGPDPAVVRLRPVVHLPDCEL